MRIHMKGRTIENEPMADTFDWRLWIRGIGATLAPPECFYHNDANIERNPIEVGTIGLVEDRNSIPGQRNIRSRQSKKQADKETDVKKTDLQNMHPRELAKLPKEEPTLNLAEVVKTSGFYIKYKILEKDDGFKYWVLADEGALLPLKPKNGNDLLRGGSMPSRTDVDGYMKKIVKRLEENEDKLQKEENYMKISCEHCPEENKFKPGMLLVAADIRQLDGFMHVAVVTKVEGDKVTLHFPDWNHEDDITVNYWYRHMFTFENAVKAKMQIVIPKKIPDQALLHPPEVTVPPAVTPTSTTAADSMRSKIRKRPSASTPQKKTASTPQAQPIVREPDQPQQTTKAADKQRRLVEHEKNTGITQNVEQLLHNANREAACSRDTTHAAGTSVKLPPPSVPNKTTYRVVTTGVAPSASRPKPPYRVVTAPPPTREAKRIPHFGPEHTVKRASGSLTRMPDGKAMAKKPLNSAVASAPALAPSSAMIPTMPQNSLPQQPSVKKTSEHDTSVVTPAPEVITIGDEEEAIEGPNTVGNCPMAKEMPQHKTRNAPTEPMHRENTEFPHVGASTNNVSDCSEQYETDSDGAHNNDLITVHTPPPHDVELRDVELDRELEHEVETYEIQPSRNIITLEIYSPSRITIPPGAKFTIESRAPHDVELQHVEVVDELKHEVTKFDINVRMKMKVIFVTTARSRITVPPGIRLIMEPVKPDRQQTPAPVQSRRSSRPVVAEAQPQTEQYPRKRHVDDSPAVETSQQCNNPKPSETKIQRLGLIESTRKQDANPKVWTPPIETDALSTNVRGQSTGRKAASAVNYNVEDQIFVNTSPSTSRDISGFQSPPAASTIPVAAASQRSPKPPVTGRMSGIPPTTPIPQNHKLSAGDRIIPQRQQAGQSGIARRTQQPSGHSQAVPKTSNPSVFQASSKLQKGIASSSQLSISSSSQLLQSNNPIRTSILTTAAFSATSKDRFQHAQTPVPSASGKTPLSDLAKLNGQHRSHEERPAPDGPSSRPPKQPQARPWYHYEDYEDRPVQKLQLRKQWEIKVHRNCHCGPLLDSNAVASLRDMPMAPFSSVLPDVLDRIVRCAKSKERVLGLLRTVSQNEEHFVFHGCFVPRFSNPVAAWLYLKEFLLRINACPKLFSLRQQVCNLCASHPRESSRQNLFKVDFDIAQTSNVPIPTCEQLSVEFGSLGRDYRLFILEHRITSEWLQCLEEENLQEVIPALSVRRLGWIKNTAADVRRRFLFSDESHADRFPDNWRECNGQ